LVTQLGNRQDHEPTPVVLSIAGFDPCSGAGVTADIKTIAAHGCYGATCITALTVQTTEGVRAVEAVKPEIVRATLRELAVDLPIRAVRIGMLGSAAVVEAVLEFLESTRPPNVVLDPVFVSSSGAELLEAAGVALLKRRMLPLISVVTPNIDEVSVLSGIAVPEPRLAAAQVIDLDPDPDTNTNNKDPRLRAAITAGEVLLDSGVKAVVVTGGHLEKPTDVLLWRPAGKLEIRAFPSRRIDARSTHGTGCAFAASLACSLALGTPLPEAVARAQQYVFRAIQTAEPLGQGIGPINHLWPLQQRS
jgi:hydroxymethylpyrimidine/phosphomethylpyrimidine kinase